MNFLTMYSRFQSTIFLYDRVVDDKQTCKTDKINPIYSSKHKDLTENLVPRQ